MPEDDLLPNYQNLNDFLDDLGANDRFEYFVKHLAANDDGEWLAVEEILQRDAEASAILHEFAFKEREPNLSFSSTNLKVRYIFDEDFVNDGSAILLFNLVASHWLHVVWLSGQNNYRL